MASAVLRTCTARGEKLGAAESSEIGTSLPGLRAAHPEGPQANMVVECRLPRVYDERAVIGPTR
jgi:hypothetical protein